MRIHFSQLFWGLLLVILDFSINGIDLFADGIGYLIVAAGCRDLVSLSPQFSTARALCFVLALLWLVGFAVSGDAVVVYGFATTIVNCVMIWHLLGGIAEFALSRDRRDLAAKAGNRRLAYVVITLGISLLAFEGGSHDAAALVVVLIGAILVLLVLILHLIHRVKTELA